MRLIINIKLVLSIAICCIAVNTYAQKHDSAYWSAWAKMYRIIDSSFNNRLDTGIVEQGALVQFQLTNGKVDTFYIWSSGEKKISNWLIPIMRPVINNQFKGYQQFTHVIVPIQVVDSRKESVGPETDMAFIRAFIDTFKHAYNRNVTIAQGLLLEPPWPAVRKKDVIGKPVKHQP